MIPLRLTAATSSADADIQKKIYGSDTTALYISNEEVENIMKIVKSCEESRLLIKGISEKIKNETKKEKGRFLLIFLGTLAVSILGNALTQK